MSIRKRIGSLLRFNRVTQAPVFRVDRRETGQKQGDEREGQDNHSGER